MIPNHIKMYFKNCKKMDLADRIDLYNDMTDLLKEMLEMEHPALATKLVSIKDIHGNDYNPNIVAPPEMKLLEHSMMKDGVTMPVVAAKDTKGKYVIVDGFHRVEVIRHFGPVYQACKGYVPLVELNKDFSDRIASTVRHNLARGTHQTVLTARLIALLKKGNWADEKIGKELGMDTEEVLRLKQLTGLAEVFMDREFSKSWE